MATAGLPKPILLLPVGGAIACPEAPPPTPPAATQTSWLRRHKASPLRGRHSPAAVPLCCILYVGQLRRVQDPDPGGAAAPCPHTLLEDQGLLAAPHQMEDPLIQQTNRRRALQKLGLPVRSFLRNGQLLQGVVSDLLTAG